VDQAPADETRYGLNTFGFGSHQAVASFVRPGSAVLDVGCGAGHLAAHLATTKQSTVIGVEADPAAARAAEAHCTSVIVGDVGAPDTLAQARTKGPYDHVICADVLEHLVDPAAALRELAGMVADGGTVVISLPNVVSLKARLRLLRGVWRYEEIGIFDRTHLRFFCLATARELVAGAGLRIEATLFVGPFSHRLGRLGARLTRVWPGLLANQFVFSASSA
jgi:methionine biosynthesis protein MetW